MEEMENCPQCGCDVFNASNRLVQDTCGHKKCRGCLLKDETNCKLCETESDVRQPPAKESVIKCSSEINTKSKKAASSFKAEFEFVEVLSLDSLPLSLVESESAIKEEIPKKPFKIPEYVTFSDNLYTCTVCNKSFTSKPNIKYHLYCTELDKPYHCPTCDKGFSVAAQMKTHMLVHSGNRPHECEECGKAFKQKGKLNRHKKVHTGVKPFVCNACGKAFYNKDNLTAHAKTHTELKLFICHVCDKKFNNNTNLNKHLATHNPERAHMCDQCGKRFKIKWALTVHRRCHTRYKPYKCNLCPKAFNNSKDLKRHRMIHLDLKPYSCGVCFTSFRRKDNLERHMKNTHPGKEVAPVVTKLPSPEPHPPVIVEKPNAIKVITAAAPVAVTPKPTVPLSTPVPVINGPLKLAFKTDAFKNTHNIYRECEETQKITYRQILPKKPYDLEESVNICQRILSPHSPLKVTRLDDSERITESAETDFSLAICQKIMTPTAPPPVALHYETSFEHKKHAMIKNIKFKLPSNYTNIHNWDKSSTATPATMVLSDDTTLTKIESETATNENQQNPSVMIKKEPTAGTTSVIVNNNNVNSPEIHWRRRTLQNLNPKNDADD